MPSRLVKACFGISIAYVSGDVVYEGFKLNKHLGDDPNKNKIVTFGVVKRATFQGLGSLECD